MLNEKIHEILKKSVDNGEVAGANILVLKDGEEKFYSEYGYRDIENKKPITRDTIFRLYSQTKPVTAAAAALLISEGVIDASANIADYLPEFSDMYVNRNGERKPAQRAITVSDLLNMTSGLPYPDDSTEGGKQSGAVFYETEQRLFSDNPVTTAEFSEMVSKIDLCFEPSERFMYGVSADITGALIERVTGKTFGTFLCERFFEPLKMNDTDFYVPKKKQERLAKVYNYSDQGLIECITNHLGLRYDRDIPPMFESGGAGLCSTLDDYSHFGTMLLNGGMFEGKRVMPKAAVDFLTNRRLPQNKLWQFHEWWGWMNGYSYGNFMRVCENEAETSLFSSVGEYGWDGWLGTFFSNEPKHNITLLMGVQQVGVGMAGTLVRKIKNTVMSELT